MTDIELVKSRLDLVPIISSYVELQRAGSNYRARCPFHQEKTPSFMVNPQLQIYKCFGCGKAGDVLTFIQEMEHLDFPSTMQYAAEKAGVELSGTMMKKDKKLEEEKKKIIEANTLAMQFYHYILTTHISGKVGRDYAQKRQIGAKEMQTFMFGYATGARENLKGFLIKKGFKAEDLVKWGLLVDRDGQIIDKFRNRLLQPIRNVQGQVVGFSGRYIGTSKDVPKYLNSPETLVYKKNEMLYGLFEAKDAIRKNKKLIVVEGNIDIVSSHRAGVEYIAAPLGTAFTPAQAKLINRMVDEVYMAFDSDSAGQTATIRTLKILEESGITHKVIDITGYQDADEMIVKNMPEWQKRIDNAQNTVEYLLKKSEIGLDLGNPDDLNVYKKRAMPILQSLKDEVQKAYFIKSVASQLGITSDVLTELMQSTPIQRNQLTVVSDQIPEVTYSESYHKEKQLLALIMNTKDTLPFVLNEQSMPNEDLTMLFEILYELRSEIPADLQETLNENQLSIYKDIMLIDTSDTVHALQTIKDLYCSLYDKQLLKRRAEADTKYHSDSENEEYISIVQEIAKERAELEKIRKIRV